LIMNLTSYSKNKKRLSCSKNAKALLCRLLR
jgi:hypothetical protein